MALRLRRDANHGAAVHLWSPGHALLTTNHVVGETWTFLRRRDGHPSAVAFLDAVEAADWLTVVHVDEGAEREARSWLRRHDERVFSFVDATSFAVMRRERVTEALASTMTSAPRASSRFDRCPDAGLPRDAHAGHRRPARPADRTVGSGLGDQLDPDRVGRGKCGPVSRAPPW